MVEIRIAKRDDLPAFLSLLHEVHDAMEHPEWFALDPDGEVLELFENGEMEIWLAWDNEVLAGGFSIVYPGLKKFNLGYTLGFNDDQLQRVVHMDAAAVAASYRGKGLQKLLMQCAENRIKQERERILLCTVHPKNQYSYNNLIKQNYTQVLLLEKYGSIRYIMRKDLP